jgi:hypothetical protein
MTYVITKCLKKIFLMKKKKLRVISKRSSLKAALYQFIPMYLISKEMSRISTKTP